MNVSVYDEPKNANITDDEVMRSCALGMISFNEIPSFSNRERYLCRTAQDYHDILSKKIDELENILWRVLEDFCIESCEDETGEDTLTTRGSNGAKMAFKYFSVKEGEPECMLATRSMLEDWEK